ncbi:MAG TPA: Stp1/IreP family PP2C-type Ser/Thr phosphatase [Acidimicrobiia bacterium]|nr:Stp1/IreP family PP2C-type Ser/Thr phosphatase [Acidimicrobiia bacterium]
MKLVVGERTDKGRVRDGNEDERLIDRRMDLYAVADGMGGHQAGEVASSTAVEALRAAVANGTPIRDAITKANEAVLERSGGDERLRGMGTTLTAATLATGGTLLIGHVGDSRAYLARDGEMRQVTDDHSLVEEMVRGGELTPEQAEVHPQRSVITRALGIDPGVEVDLYTLELRDGDRVLLCSDGLSGMVRTEEIAAILEREPDPQKAANELVDAANKAGGEDNITVVLLDVVADDSPAAAVLPDDRAGPAEEPVPSRRRRRRRLPGAARVLRIARWVLPVLLVLALAFGAVGWYARRTYFLEIDRGRVTLFQGVPGGFLAWDPTVEERTAIEEGDLTEAEVNDLEGGKRFSSRDKAEAFVDRLDQKIEDRQTAATTTTTTTTVPPPPPPPA